MPRVQQPASGFVPPTPVPQGLNMAPPPASPQVQMPGTLNQTSAMPSTGVQSVAEAMSRTRPGTWPPPPIQAAPRPQPPGPAMPSEPEPVSFGAQDSPVDAQQNMMPAGGRIGLPALPMAQHARYNVMMNNEMVPDAMRPTLRTLMMTRGK